MTESLMTCRQLRNKDPLKNGDWILVTNLIEIGILRWCSALCDVYLSASTRPPRRNSRQFAFVVSLNSQFLWDFTFVNRPGSILEWEDWIMASCKKSFCSVITYWWVFAWKLCRLNSLIHASLWIFMCVSCIRVCRTAWIFLCAHVLCNSVAICAAKVRFE